MQGILLIVDNNKIFYSILTFQLRSEALRKKGAH